MYLLGWDGTAVVASSESMTLDLEDEMEKQRRLDDEFKAKISREKYVISLNLYLYVMLILTIIHINTGAAMMRAIP